MRWISAVFAVATCAMVAGAGCHHEPLPAHAWAGPEAAIAQLHQRAEQVRTIEGEGSILLRSSEGRTVRLDGAIVAELPDRLHIRAWKLGQPVFDLTLDGKQAWIFVPDQSRRGQILPAGASAAQVARGLAVLQQSLRNSDVSQITQTSGDRLLLTQPAADGTRLRTEVDRATLTTRRQQLLDAQDHPVMSVEYRDYRLINGIPWPLQMVFQSKQGLIQLDLDSVQLNQPPLPAAFVPPKRAEKLP